MIFKQEGSVEDTLQSWEKQLNNISVKKVRLYDNSVDTLNEWCRVINKYNKANLKVYETPEKTINVWATELTRLFM